ncbi:hypothetical protein VPHD528_0100 [Vibrio phage D528]
MAFPVIVNTKGTALSLLDIDKAVREYPDYLSDKDIGQAMANYQAERHLHSSCVLEAQDLLGDDHGTEATHTICFGDAMIHYKVARAKG